MSRSPHASHLASAAAADVVRGRREIAGVLSPAVDAAWQDRLRSEGVGPEGLVAVMDPDPVAAGSVLLAAVGLGAAIAPLDASAPEAARARVVDRLASLGRLVSVTDLHAGPAGAMIRRVEGKEPTTRDQSTPSLSDIAWILHTSGSTGIPRGVVQSRPGCLADLADFRREHGVTDGTRVSWLGSPWWAGGLRELLGTAVAGGVLVAGPGPKRDPAALAAFVRSARLDVLRCVPGVLRHLDRGMALDPTADAVMPEVRLVSLAGDRVESGDLEIVRRRFPNAELRTSFGSTEIATVSHTWLVPRDFEPDPSRGVPIGEPVPGRTIEVVDPAGRAIDAASETPITGGLRVRDERVALGTLDDDGFRPFPTGADVPAERDGVGRWIDSGDRVRRDADGRWWFLGRLDRTGSVGGVRIDPGEVETIARGVTGVAAAAAVIEDGRMVLGVTALPGFDRERLRADVLRGLPSTRRPSVVAVLEALPATATGKIDAARLVAVIAANTPETVPPGSDLESIIAAAYGVQGRDDRWRATGADSLDSVRIAMRIERESGRRCTADDLVDDPSVAELATRLADSADDRTVEPGPAIGASSGPLLPHQYGLWSKHRDDPDVVSLLGRVVFEIRGAVDPDRWREAHAAVVARHQALRAAIHPGPDGPMLIADAADSAAVALGVVRLDGVGQDTPLDDPAIRDPIVEFIARPVNLERGPLHEARLWRLGEGSDRWIFASRTAHLIGDLWSRRVYLRDLAEALDGHALSPVPGFVDVAAWWSDRDRDEKADEAFWRSLRPADPSPASLGRVRDDDEPTTNWQCGAGHRIDAKASAAVDRLARATGATRSGVLAAAWGAWTAALCGRDEIVLGTAVSVRDHPDLDEVYGHFSANVPLPILAAEDQPFEVVVRTVAERLARVRRHARVPLGSIARWWGAEPGRPLFAIGFVDHFDESYGWRPPGVEVTPCDPSSIDAAIEVELYVRGDASGIDLLVNFSRRFGSPQAWSRLLEDFAAFVIAAVDSPATRLGDLPLTAGPTVLDGGPGDASVPVIDRVLAGLDRTPDRIAVIDRRGDVTAADLRHDLDRVAAAAVGRGWQGRRVAMRLERDRTQIAALLGLWRAGVTVVPIGGDDPEERVRRILDEVRPVAIVTDRDDDDRTVSAATLLASAHEIVGSWPSIDPDSIAYVLHTSGSTGRPRGVPIRHGAAGMILQAMAELVGPFEGGRMLATTTVGFDIFVVDQLLALAAGGTTVIADDGLLNDPRGLVEFAARHRTDLVQTTPARLRQMLAAGWRPAVRDRVISGGEPLDPPLRDELVRDGARLYNVYGPTEATVWATGEAVAATGPITIGRPLPGWSVVVRDRLDRDLPPGVQGRIDILGAGVADGYLDRPDATVAAFRTEPDGRRTHRTGDLGRVRRDGRLECGGRVDDRIKIRGIRIEPGEIEQAVLAITECRTVVAAARTLDGGDSEPRIVVWHDGPDLDAAAVRSALRSHLPEPAIPARFVRVVEWPTTASGKLDRRAVTERASAPVEIAEGSRRQVRTADRGDDEFVTIVRHAAGRVLGIEVAADADLLALGDSIASVRIALELERRLGRPVPIGWIGSHPTPVHLAAAIARGIHDEAATPLHRLGTIEPSPGAPVMIALPGLGGTIHSWRRVADRLSPDLTVLASPFAGIDGGPPLDRIEAMADRVGDAARAAGVQEAMVVGYSFGGLVAWSLAARAASHGLTISSVGLVDTVVPFGPVARWTRRLRRLGRRSRFAFDPVAGLRAADREGRGFEALARTIAAGRRAWRRYRPEPLDASSNRVILFRTDDGPVRRMPDGAGGWSRHAPDLRLVDLPGSHLGVFDPPAVDQLAAVLGGEEKRT